MPTTKSQLNSGLKLADIQTAQQGLSSEQIAQKANEVVAKNTKPVINSDLLKSSPTPYKLPPQMPSVVADSTQAYIESQNNTVKTAQQRALDMQKAELDRNRNDISSLIYDLGNEGQYKEQIYKEQGVDAAKQQVDDYTSQIEAEQLANRRAVERLQKNNGGLFGGAMEQEINRITNESVSKQADLAILQNASLRRYSTAAEIADRQLQAKMEPMRAKLEALKFFYTENKADFNKADDRAYSEYITAKDREYQEAYENQKANTEMLKEAVAFGAPVEALQQAQSIINSGGSQIDVALLLGSYSSIARQIFESDRAYGLQSAQFGLQQDAFGFEQLKYVNELNAAQKRDTSWQDINGKRVLVDNQTGEIITNPTAADPVDPQVLMNAENNIGDLNKLITGDLANAVGANRIARINLLDGITGAKGNVIATVEQITGQLTLDSLQRAKANGATFGALSDSELDLLKGSASKINSWAIKKDGKTVGYDTTPANFKAELEKIANLAKLDYLKKGGNPQSAGITVTNDGKYWTLNSKGQYTSLPYTPPAQQLYGPTFNSAGNASASNQVKGYTSKVAPLQQIQLKPTSQKPGGMLTQTYPPGSYGGQCGTWVRSIVQRQGLTYPPVGNSLAEKAAIAKKYGVPPSQARIGSVLLTNESKVYGHVAYVIGANKQGYIVAESNYGLDGKVKYGRVIPYGSPKLLGILNPTKG